MSQRFPHKNASTFNPFDQSTSTQKSIDDQNKQKKRDMQDFYKDQLDHSGPSHQASKVDNNRKQWETKPSNARVQPSKENNAGAYFGQDDGRSNDELSKKKRLQEEMFRANQQQVEQKEAQKRKEKAAEKENDKRRVEEAMYSYSQDDLDRHDKQRRLVEQNDKAVQMQRKEYNSRNQKKEFDMIPAFKDEPMHAEHHKKHFERINQTSDYEKLSSGMDNLNLKGKAYNNQNSGNSMRSILQQSSENSQQSHVQPQSGHGKAYSRQGGNSYNIITNDY